MPAEPASVPRIAGRANRETCRRSLSVTASWLNSSATNPRSILTRHGPPFPGLATGDDLDAVREVGERQGREGHGHRADPEGSPGLAPQRLRGAAVFAGWCFWHQGRLGRQPTSHGTDYISHWNLVDRFRWLGPGRCCEHLPGLLI